MTITTTALSVHYLSTEFLEVEKPSETPEIIALLYFTKEVDNVEPPLKLSLLQAQQLYNDLKMAFD